MGNYVSCKLSDPVVLPISLSKSTKIFLPTGEIRKLQEPIKAAELMLESPNFFVVDASTLKIGRRFCALNADHDLERASTYILFPMHRKNSVVTANDLGQLLVTANTFIKRASKGDNTSRVLPESVGKFSPGTTEEAAAVVPRIDLQGTEDISTPEFRYRMSMARSKRPSLETIQEEPSPCHGNALPLEFLLKSGGQKYRYILHPKLCYC